MLREGAKTWPENIFREGFVNNEVLYPFPVAYAEIDDSSGYPCWKATDHNWTDGQKHLVYLLPDGQYYHRNGSIYDENFDRIPLRPCNPSLRMAYATASYTAAFYTENDQLFCPNSHKARDNYGLPGCFSPNCPFFRIRMFSLTKFAYYEGELYGGVPIDITIDGQQFIPGSREAKYMLKRF